MRITLFLLFFGILFSQAATGYSQGVELTLNLKSTSIKGICEEIEKKSDFRFIFAGNAKKIINKKVDLTANSQDINEILDNILSNTGLKYRILDNQVVVYRDEAKIIPKKIDEIVSELIIQQQKKQITGKIIDKEGEPIIGANVIERGISNGTVTDIDGNFTLNVENNAVLHISYIGYLSQDINTTGRTSFNIVLEEDTKALEEVVVIGYGTQRKATLTGAVSSIKGDAITVTKNENVQNMLTGKVPGVRVWQRSAEPGAFDTNFDIRGFSTSGTAAPLIVIDGVTRTMAEFQRLSPNDIEDISVLKDGTAAIYGVRAANGVIVVSTKKGKSTDKTEVNYTGSYSFQFPSGLPKTADVYGYITMRNWSAQNNKNGTYNPGYDDDFIARVKDGTIKSYDWNDYILNSYAPENQHNLSISGGNDRTQYYISAGYFYQNSFFKGNDRNYNKNNLMSNISTKIIDGLTLDLSLSAIIDKRNQPDESAVWTIRDFWRMNPLIGPYADDDETMLNQAVTETENPLSMIYSDYIGSQTTQKKWFDATASLTYEVPWVKGLSIKGLFGYNYNLENYRQYKKKTYQYTYDEASDTYTQGVASRYNVNRYLHEQYFKTQTISQFVLNYNTKIDNHSLGTTLIWESLWREGDNLYAQRELAFPKETMAAGVALNQQGGIRTGDSQYYERTNNALAGRFNYSFADKYLAEFQFRYDGSSIFAPGHRWGFFPSGSVAWRVSEEDFFKNSSLGFIEQLKLRTSYGITGDDTAGQYQYMTGYNYPLNANEERFSTGYMFNGSWIGSVSNRGIPNPNITWYKSKTFNLGIDFDAWNGLFGFTFEYFDRHRDGLLATRTGGIPTVVGASLPQENLNSDRHFGLELQLTHRNRVSDFSYRTSLMGTITRHQRLDYDERTFNSSRDKWLNSQSNRYQGIYWSQYEYAGQFQNWNQIWDYDVFTGSSTYLGNYYYADWNGDGEVSSWDNHPVYFNSTPLVNYSLSFSAAYKKFDLDILFQGSAFGSLQYGEQIRGDSSTLEAILDRWHPKDPTADPYNPNTEWVKGYYAFNPRGQDNGTFNRVNTAYLRLKNIELGYNLPEYRSLKSRVFISGYNVFTLTKVRNYDPENPGGDSSWGFMYPHNKTLTLGLSLTF